jgi:predicted RNase H-like HicB family nuclease
MKQYQFGAVIVREGRWFVARCLQLPVTSQGPTIAKAKASLQEAITLYLESFGPSSPLRAALRLSKGGEEHLQASPEELTLTTLTITV